MLKPLQKVYLRTPDSDKPIPARVVGIKKDMYVFEPLRVDFGQFRHGSKLLFVRGDELECGVVEAIKRRHYVGLD